MRLISMVGIILCVAARNRSKALTIRRMLRIIQIGIGELNVCFTRVVWSNEGMYGE